MEDRLKIKVKVADREYPMNIGRDNEEKIRRAAKEINDKIARYRRQYVVSDPSDYLAMAALQTSVENVERQSENVSARLLEQLAELDRRLDDYLRGLDGTADGAVEPEL